ncbi:MAG: hypothetical protein WCV86_04225 [Patescibacteria group bacterium]|jgi:hypothetical protein
MPQILQHKSFPYVMTLLVLLSGVLLGVLYGSPVWAAWIQTPVLEGYENAVIHDIVMLEKSPDNTPENTPYVGYAVGQLDGTQTAGAIILYYNGVSWSHLYSDEHLGILRGVDARYDGTKPEVIAVGDYTVSSGYPTPDFNTIIHGVNNIFSIQTYQEIGGVAGAHDRCNPIIELNCKSWVADGTDLVDAAFGDQAIIHRYEGGACAGTLQDDGLFIIGDTQDYGGITGIRGTFLVGQRCVDSSSHDVMWVMRDQLSNPYYPTLFSSLATPIVGNFTAMTYAGHSSYFIAADRATESKASLFKFSMDAGTTGFKEVSTSGVQFNDAGGVRTIESLSAVLEPGPAADAKGPYWHVYATTATDGNADTGVVHLGIYGDAASGLSDGLAHTRFSTSKPISDVGAVIQYRGGNILANSNFTGTHENNAHLPEGWHSSDSIATLYDTTIHATDVVDNPSAPEGPSGKVLQLAQELIENANESAAVQFWTDNTFTTRVTTTQNELAHPFIGSLDADALLGTVPGSNAFRITGFFKGHPSDTYDFQLSLTHPGDTHARLFIGNKIADSNGDFDDANAIADKWTATAPGFGQFTFDGAGGEILDSMTLGDGAGVRESEGYYPFVFEFARDNELIVGRSVTLQWKKDGSATYDPFNPAMRVGNSSLIDGGLGQQAASEQPLPHMRGPKGPAYLVKGKVRVAKAPDAFFNANDRDPRKPGRAWGGIYTRCEDPAWGDCGFNWSIETIDPKVESDTLTTEDPGTGGWREFQYILAKTGEAQNYMTVVCYAEYGVKTWCADFSIEPVQEATQATAPRYMLFASSPDGSIFSGNAELPGTMTLKEEVSGTVALRAIDVASPVKGAAGGDHGGLFDIIPGLVQGWGWVGATTTGTSKDALGWISFSCADSNQCNEHQLSYGVNLGSALPGNLHPLDGAAWFGTTDVNQVRQLDGAPIAKDSVCTGDDRYICSHYVPDPGDPGAPADANAFCQSLGAGTCPAASQVCSVAPSFADCDIECSPITGHPFGCASVGWLSFERNTDPLLSTGRPPCDNGSTGPCLGDLYSTAGTSQTYTAAVDFDTGIMSGWGRLLSLASTINETNVTPGGWVKFLGSEVSGFTGDLYECVNCQESALGYHCRLCFLPDPTVGNPFPGLCSRTTPANPGECTGRCSNDLSGTCTTDATCGAGEACLPNGWCDGVVGASACFSNSDCPGTECTNIGFTCDTTSATCYRYGTGLDTSSGKFHGFAWSNDVGWVDMSRVRYGNQPWFQTLQGNIFSADNVGDASNVTPVKCNATYRITAVGTLENVCSASAANPFEVPFEVDADLGDNLITSDSDKSLETVFGATDLAGLLNDNDGDFIPDAFGIGKGRYASELVNLNNGPTRTIFDAQLGGGGLLLDNKVYYYCGEPCGNSTLELSDGLILNGTADDESGDGTLVVLGDLIFIGDILYKNVQVDSLTQLASLGIIVLGDVQIKNSVNEIDATLYALGNPALGVVGQDPLAGRRAGTIRIDGGTSAQYVHRGLMIAREFSFKRVYGGLLSDPDSAEKVIYDGRVVANPPPGFTTLQKALPLLRQSVPTN